MTTETGLITCDMVKDCAGVVTHLDRDGYVYCTRHGLTRRMDQPCRKLRPAEIIKLRQGEPLPKY